jgi:hypothetical protein
MTHCNALGEDPSPAAVAGDQRKLRRCGCRVEALGEDALTEEEINELKRLGLLRGSVRHFVGDSYTLGKIAQLVERAKAEEMSYAEAMKIAAGICIYTNDQIIVEEL